jgi:hypothetical protein
MTNELERTVLFASLRGAIPAVLHYPDDLIASKIKNVDLVAKEFLILVKAELDQKYVGAPDNNQMLLSQQGMSAMKYIKRTIETWSWKVTIKTLCDNIDLLQNKYADECPTFAECNIKLDYKTAHLA